MSARKEQRVEAGTTVNDVSRVNASTRTSDRRPETDTAPGFTVTGEIAVHRGAVSGVAVSNDGALLVVTHFGADSLSLIDTATGAVAQTVIDIDEPFAVAMSDTSAGCAYVSSVSAAYDSVLAFDTDANRVVATYPLAFSVTDLAVSPDGRRVYAGRTAVDGADVAIIDTATGHDNTISVATTAGTTIACVRVSPDGRRLYVAANSASAAELVVIDTRQNRVVSTIEIGSPIRDIALSPEGSTAYVGSCGPDFGTVLDVIDVRDVRASAITNTYKIGDAAGVLAQLAMSRNGQRAYLVGDQSVTVLVHLHAGHYRQHRDRWPAVLRDRERWTASGCTSPTTPAWSPFWGSPRQPRRPTRRRRTTKRPLRSRGQSPTCGYSSRRRLSPRQAPHRRSAG